jgi:alkyl sulfatase BDS1-like metallo-beta-lactamase superfamily hydrolase
MLFIAAAPLTARAADEQKHFSPKGKPASTYTIEVQQKARETLPFSDRQDFVEAKKGFIAA